MKLFTAEVTENRMINDSTFILSCKNKELSEEINAGQFCNIKVNDTYVPLLRRPFSISDVDKDILSFMISINGKGTELLSKKHTYEKLDILGPLGNSFGINDCYDIAILVSGGIGIAPFPYLIKSLKNKPIIGYFGFRTKKEIIKIVCDNYYISTDDGSFGMKGTVIDLLKRNLLELKKNKIKIFACGPTPMLKAVQLFCLENNINGEISTESAMACGFGICQGCPIESREEDKYKLICKDGPIFNVKEINL